MANQPVPVEACTGWASSCPFCDKRFSEWIEPCTEEDMEKIPENPGAFMFCFDSKQKREVVMIGVHKSNIRIPIHQKLGDLKQQISHKKFKETKSSILVRWVCFPKIEDRVMCSILTHWHNCGTLPRMTKNWPGLDVLQNSSEFTYSELCKKWCYPLKDPVWKKPKDPPPAQAVTKCKGWNSSCAYCDSRFTVWLPVEEALNRKEDLGGAPIQQGLCMFSAVYKDQKQVVLIESCSNIKNEVYGKRHWLEYTLKRSDEFGNTVKLDVRWMVVNDLDKGDVCFVYAHFLNYQKNPLLNREPPGEEILHRTENFVFRHRDRQWCYQEEKVVNPTKFKKNKHRRFLLNSLSDELQNSEEYGVSQSDKSN